MQSVVVVALPGVDRISVAVILRGEDRVSVALVLHGVDRVSDVVLHNVDSAKFSQ